MFRSEPLRYITYFVKPKCETVENAFRMLEDHFITNSHVKSYTTEWNSLKFKDIQEKHKEKSNAEVLDTLYQRGQYIQSMLPEEYHSPLLLRDFVLRAVRDEEFYEQLITSTIPDDPNQLHTILHQCIQQKGKSSKSKKSITDNNVFNADIIEVHESKSDNSEFEKL